MDTEGTVEAEQVAETISLPAVRERKPELVAGHQVLAIIPRTIDEVFRVAKAVWKAKLAPETYTRNFNDEEQISRIVVGIMKGAEVGLAPITALGTIAIINGKPCIWGDGVVALLQSSGKLAKMKIEEIGTIPGEDDPTNKFASDYGIRVTMWRVGQDEPYIGKFTVGDARRADLWMNARKTPWIQHPKRMLKWRAAGAPTSDGFSDVLMGLMIREIAEDLPPLPSERPAASTAFLDDEIPEHNPAQLAGPTQAPFEAPQTAEKEPVPVAAEPEVVRHEPAQAEPARVAPEIVRHPPQAEEPKPPKNADGYARYVEDFIRWTRVATAKQVAAHMDKHEKHFGFIRDNRTADKDKIDEALDEMRLRE